MFAKFLDEDLAPALQVAGGTMIAMVSSIPAGEYVPTADKRLVMSGLDWSELQALLALRGERSGLRITYVDGTVEIMGASFDHERIKCFIARMVEDFCLDRGIRLTPVGSWHLADKALDAAAEPDQCYVFGPEPRARSRPDLAIEVVWTSGGLNKLEVYRRLGVREVWYWRDDEITVHVLGPSGYEPQPRSVCLPDLDVAVIARLVGYESFNDAVLEMRAATSRTPEPAS